MSRTTSKLVRLDSLQPHPENQTIYRDSDRTDQENEELRSSISAYGLWEGQLQIHGPTMTILSGHRRVSLAMELGIQEAVVTLRNDLPEDPADAEVVRFLLNGNSQREKNNVEKLREFEVRKEVEKQLAKRYNTARKFKNSDPGQIGQDRQSGTSRDIAARKAGLGGSGSRAEKALAALKKADSVEASEPAKAKAIRSALNQSINAGPRVAAQVLAEPVTAPANHRTKEQEPIGKTVKFVNTIKPTTDPALNSGPKVRNIHRCRELDGFTKELEYLKVEMPKAIEKAKAAEKHLRKIGDHLRDGFVDDRNYAQFMTVWATAWKEDGTYDFIADMESLASQLSMLQGAHTGFQRFAFTEDVRIDRMEPS